MDNVQGGKAQQQCGSQVGTTKWYDKGPLSARGVW